MSHRCPELCHIMSTQMEINRLFYAKWLSISFKKKNLMCTKMINDFRWRFLCLCKCLRHVHWFKGIKQCANSTMRSWFMLIYCEPYFFLCIVNNRMLIYANACETWTCPCAICICIWFLAIFYMHIKMW